MDANAFFPVFIIPAQKVVAMPDAKLRYDRDPRKNPIVPPRNADSVPMYGPRSNPIIGAIMAAAVIACPGRPIIGEIFRKPKIA